jgi:hypothetical protein
MPRKRDLRSKSKRRTTSSHRNLSLADGSDAQDALQSVYNASWAVVIGINGYRHIEKLTYAVNDADGMARLLITELGFPKEKVFVILDPAPGKKDLPYELAGTQGTKPEIERWIYTELPARAEADDRVIIFFAGHGERRRLPTGEEVGYLIPADAQPQQWHTYITTHNITEAGNYCRAKHVFYLFDACYSGLAFTRASVTPTPYEETMLKSRARQALTAGTAKEAVNDKGPQGHSPFTWYVLQGLRGEAAQKDSEVVTASDLMVYVKNQVGRSFGARQTPDFGKLPGHESGGDFVFRLPAAGRVVDLSQWVRVRDQGPEPTSTAAAVVTAAETLMTKRGDPLQLSIKQLYDRAKKHDEVSGEGTWLTAVVYVAEQFGIQVESAQKPIRDRGKTGSRKKHPSSAAEQFVYPRFYRLKSLKEIPEQLRLGRPVVAGCKVFKNWYENPSGEIVAPGAEKELYGVIAITIVGYDSDQGFIRFANSWGESWGQRGFGTMGLKAMQALLESDMMWALDMPADPQARGGNEVLVEEE